MRRRKLEISTFLTLSLMGMFWFVSNASARTFQFSELGDPQGYIRGFFRFDSCSGSNTVENYANYHVCSDPAYSVSNFTEIDGTRGGGSGTPACADANNSVGTNIVFERARTTYVEFKDNSASCTTGNDPWDHSNNTDNFILSFNQINVPTPTCADIGKKYMLASKWNSAGGQCSYQVYLEQVDRAGGGCGADSEVSIRLKVNFDDAGGTFSCGSPCQTILTGTNMESFTSTVNNLLVVFEPDATTSKVSAYQNGFLMDSANTTTCADFTDIPDPFQINNSTADLILGNDTVGGSDAYDNNLGTVFIGQVPSDVLDEGSDDQAEAIWAYHFDEAVGITNSEGMPGFDSHGTMARAYTEPSGGTVPTIDTTDKLFGDGAIELDGTEDVVVINSRRAMNGTGLTNANLDALYVEAWIRPHDADGGGTKDQSIISAWRFANDASCSMNSSRSTFILYLDSSGKLNLKYNDVSTGENIVTGTTVLTDNKWYHVAGIVTHGTTYNLATRKAYVFLNGVDDSVTPGTVSATPGLINANDTQWNYIGATDIAGSIGTTCDPGATTGVTNYFDGEIDEVFLHVPASPNPVIEAAPNGVVINEVNYRQANENIELYMLPGIGTSADLNDHTLRVCSQSSKTWEFDDTSVSKLVDPGDLVTLVFGSGTDTSCTGGATTCTWYSANSSGSSDFVAGDLGVSDGVALYAALNPSSFSARYATLYDAVYWGGDQGTCTDEATLSGRGNWQTDQFIDVDAVATSSHSICLYEDGNTNGGVLGWTACNSTVGVLNSTQTTAIDLLRFEANLLPTGSVKVEWQTGAEFDTFGFHLYRADSLQEARVKQRVNEEIILSRGSSTSGSSYTVTDAKPGKIDGWYWLGEIELNGMERLYGPYQIAQITPSNFRPSGSIVADENLSADDQRSTGGKSKGCGKIARKSDDHAAMLLLLFFVVVLLASTRSHKLAQKKMNTKDQ